MGLKDYLPFAIAFLLVGAQAYLSYNFIISNIKAPGTPFVTTLVLSILGLLFGLLALMETFPRFKEILVKKYSSNVYLVSFAILVIISVVFTGIAIYTRSIEYTQHQATLN